MNTEQKIAKLIFLVNEYLKYTIWTNVGITVKENQIFVTWFTPIFKAGKLYLNSTLRAFTTEDLDERIKSYKDKIRKEKKQRLITYMNNMELEPENTPEK